MDTPNETAPAPDLDYGRLDRELDRTKTRVFLGKSAAFLGPLMCSMNFSWTEDIQTACTDGTIIWWNPRFFLEMPPEVRETVLLHELWHPAYLHMVRRGTRDPQWWNYAADIVINNVLDDEGYSFGTFKPWMDHKYDGWTTEDVYDDLIRQRDEVQLSIPPQWIVNIITGQGDPTDLIEPGDPDTKKAIEHTVLNNVVSAVHSATLSGGAGNMPGEVETTLKRFLAPKIDWDKALFSFFNDLGSQDYSWARPNRRYQDVYLPSLQEDFNGLSHVIYYEDVSGSISDGDAIRFNSEFKYVHDHFQPEKMTMVQFDTKIQKEDVFLKDDDFNEVKIVGRGGTSLVCVRDHIMEHQPTAVVIFSDMQCTPMEPLPQNLQNIPIIWIALNNRSAKVPHGTIFHLTA
jgi:predicted metal-dependent peptidase